MEFYRCSLLILHCSQQVSDKDLHIKANWEGDLWKYREVVRKWDMEDRRIKQGTLRIEAMPEIQSLGVGEEVGGPSE